MIDSLWQRHLRREELRYHLRARRAAEIRQALAILAFKAREVARHVMAAAPVRFTRKYSVVVWNEIKKDLHEATRTAPISPPKPMLFNLPSMDVPPASDIPATVSVMGAPQVPFRPKRMIVHGTDKTVAEGGTKGLLIRWVYVGASIQMNVAMPAGHDGIPVEMFSEALSPVLEFNDAYPAIGITVSIANTTKHVAKAVRITFEGLGIR